MSTTSTVQVRYRHHEIAAAAPLSEFSGGRDGTHRLELDDPPPVRTVLAIIDDGRTRAFEVCEVVEVPSEGAPRGCVLVEVALDRLPHAVGTEDRTAGLLGSAESRAEVAPVADEADTDGYGAHMAVPAPVVSDDASGPLELGGDSDGDDASEDDDDPSEDDNGNGGTPAAETTADGNAATPDGPAGGRAKKRRGRQRR